MALKAHLKRTLEHWPALYAGLLRLRAYVHPTAGEPELQLLPKLCPGDETAIDVGAIMVITPRSWSAWRAM